MNPGLSARYVLSRSQQVIGVLLLVTVGAFAVVWPLATLLALIGVASVVFLASTLFKFFIALRGSRYDLVARVRADEIDALRDEDLPMYTVLVPVFREARIVGRLVVVGNALMVYLNMMGPYKRGAFWLVGWAILNPVYWLLHSLASYKALWQLITKPHYWQKTEHGMSHFTLDGVTVAASEAPVEVRAGARPTFGG